MVADAPSPVVTADAYRALERNSSERHEFVDGHVYLMAGGTRLHAAVGRNVVALLTAAMGDGPCEVYNSDMRVRLSEAVQVYPDATVTCDERDRVNDEDDEIAHPRLVIEVLSPGTERADRGRKLRDYQTCPTIEEYVLVSTEYQAIEVYRRGATGWTYHRYEAGHDAELTSISARLPFTALYRRTAVPIAPAR
ncbi:MAG: Uma2 family endonuclease [Chloroflexota bacterium]|nr:Uma2 family endonuclease [Chloroflexota bacterium]